MLLAQKIVKWSTELERFRHELKRFKRGGGPAQQLD
jgi:hypothetical protein